MASSGEPIRLYVILGSHACRAAMLMLDHKRLPYSTVTLPTGMHAPAVRVLGFEGRTVPALRADGERVQTNPEIARFLDRLHPEPPLFPSDPGSRAAVEEAERWGQDELQMTARRLVMAGALHGRDGLVGRGGSGRLGPLLWRNDTVRLLAGRAVGRLKFMVTAKAERELLDAVPGMLDRIDAWIEAGVLNRPDLNAADFVIAPNLALLCYRADVGPEVERRPAGALVERVFADA